MSRMQQQEGRSVRSLITIGAALASSSLFAQTGDWREAIDEAEELIAKSRRLGGDVFAHEARELLAPWWDIQNPPLKIRLQRATLLQRDHHFEEALTDINEALRTNPKSTEAWLMKTTILTVLGKYEEARSASIPLFGLAPPLVALTAGTAPTSSNGELEQSYEFLKDAVEKYQDAPPAVQAWSQTALAEMAVRMGEIIAADNHFRAALLIDQSSPYLLNAYAYFMLEQKQPKRVLGLLKNVKEDIPLPWLLAENAVNGQTPEFQKVLEIFEHDKKKVHLVHGHSHGREEAIYFLFLKNDPLEALHQAQENWASQREAADLLILLQASIAAEDEVTLASTLRWIEEKDFEDHRLAKLKKEARKIISG